MDSEKKDYIIKQAEAIVAECEKNVNKSLNNRVIRRKNNNSEKKYKILKSCTSAIILIETIICIILAFKR